MTTLSRMHSGRETARDRERERGRAFRVEGSQRRREAGLEGRRSHQVQRGKVKADGADGVFFSISLLRVSVVPRLTVMSPSSDGSLTFKTGLGGGECMLILPARCISQMCLLP